MTREMKATAVHLVEAGDSEAARKHGLTVLATCGVMYIPNPHGIRSDLPSCADCEALGGRIDRGVRAARSDDRPHFVYRHYDADGVLLYVGCTVDPKTRQLGHQQNSWWYSQSVKVRMTVFPDKLHARRVEREAIRTERPLWNVRHQDFTTWTDEQAALALALTAAAEVPDAVVARVRKIAGVA